MKHEHGKTKILIKGAVDMPDKTFKLGNDILAVKVTFDAEFWSPVLNQLDSFLSSMLQQNWHTQGLSMDYRD